MLLEELDAEEMELRTMPGDLAAAKDLNWILKHPGEAKNIVDAKAQREAYEFKVKREAAMTPSDERHCFLITDPDNKWQTKYPYGVELDTSLSQCHACTVRSENRVHVGIAWVKGVRERGDLKLTS